MFFDDFGVRQKGWPKIAMISDFSRQIENGRLVLGGSAGEAVCGGRERVGVMLPESIELRAQHAAPRVAAEISECASASTAAPSFIAGGLLRLLSRR